VKKGDLTALKERLFVLAADSHLRQRLGERGHSFVTERFGVQRMVDDLHTLYLHLIQLRADPKARSAALTSLSRPR